MSVSLPPATGTGECTLFRGVSRRRPSLLSCFSCPVLQHSLPSPELQAHTCEQAISARHTTLSPLAPRRSDGCVVVAAVTALQEGQCHLLWGCHFARMRLVPPRVSWDLGSAGVYPRVFFPLPVRVAQGTSSPELRSQHKHKHGRTLALATATPWPFFCVSSWRSHSPAPSPAACCSFKLLSGSFHTLPTFPSAKVGPGHQSDRHRARLASVVGPGSRHF